MKILLAVYGVVVLNLSALLFGDDPFDRGIPLRAYVVHTVVSGVVAILIIALYLKLKEFVILRLSKAIVCRSIAQRLGLAAFVVFVSLLSLFVLIVFLYVYVEWVRVYLL